ncbi:MAG: HAMP domain-containing protein [Gammaproteobacteria bacterium]|nr:HAMP domain-containing protein [Gammaproteobacteria bacterium]
MNQKLKNSILFRVALAMAAIVSLSFAGMFSSVFIAQTSEGFAAAINQAGTLRMQSYRIASSLVHHLATDTPYSEAATRRLVEEFEQRLLSERIHHVVSEDGNPVVFLAYRVVEDQWSNIMRPALNNYMRSTDIDPLLLDLQPVDDARQFYLSNVDGFVDNIHLLVKALEIEAENKIQQLRILQIFILILTLIVIAIIMRFMQMSVLSPLKKLMSAASAVRKGDFSVRAAVKRDDELGRLGTAFNTMSENLSEMYAELEHRVKQKTADLERTNRSLELLYMTTKRLSESPISQDVMTEVIQDIEEQIGILSGTVCLGKPGDPVAYRMASTGQNTTWNINEGDALNCERCFGKGEAHTFKVRLGTPREHSVYSIPIVDQDRQYGVLLVELNSNDKLDDWKKRLLETVASHIALALNMTEKASQSRMLALSEERSVIARELHDSLAQSLSYLKIQVSRLEKSILSEADMRQSLDISDGIRDALNDAYRQLRELLTTFRLRINEAGLAAALEETVREFDDRSDVDIELVSRIGNCQFGANAEIHLIHIIREALANILQHAQASKARVLLQCDAEGKATLLIEDNGIGLLEKQAQQHHYGLTIMQERAGGLGGKLEVSHPDAAGTTLKLTFEI